MAVVRNIDALKWLDPGPPRRPMSLVRRRLRDEALALCRAEQLGLGAAYCYRFVSLEGEANDQVCMDGEHQVVSWTMPVTDGLTGLACCVCTLGPRLPERIRSLFGEKRRALAVGLDELANEMLMVVGRRAQDRMLGEALRHGLKMSGELRAGDPGLALGAQALVLRMAGAVDIGVTLTNSMLMQPEKSSSAVIGVGVNLPSTRWTRCDDCRSRERCRMKEFTQVTEVA